ncbi:MAG: Ig-like domain-containing protein, partial [Armatimonadota bacterium]|nr:Ig-like domain-containing protein [Armatimonadota bacterium]
SKGTKTIKIQVNPEQTLGEIFDENNTAERQLNITAKWGSIELWLKNSQGAVLQPQDVLDMDFPNLPRIYAAERYSIGAALYRGAIQSDGKVKFDLPAGLYSIFVRTKENVNNLDTSAEVNLHEATGVVPHVLTEIVLPTMASITGRVLDKRTSEPIPPAPPIPGSTEERPATIFMGVYSDACDSEGLFNLTKIFPGTYTLRIEHPFYYAKEISVNLQPGQNLNLGDILMVRDGVFDTTGHITLEAASGGGGSIYTNSRTVKISAWAEDINGIAGMKFANDGEDWGTEITSCPTTWTLRDEDGNRTVSVRFKDGAGNWSAIFSASIRLDRQGPTGSVVINNGDETTDQNNVVLTFGATDPADGTVAAVSLSNDGVNWSSPMPYIEPIVWPLSGGYGLKTVYAKFLDACGNWSSVVSDSIEVLPIASISLENSAGLPITTFTNENTVYARVNTGIFAESPRQTQDFSGDSSASETTAAAQSFVPHNSVTICGTRLVGMKNTSSEGFLVVELRVAPQGSTIASSPENSALVAYGMTSSTAIKSNPMPGPVDIVFGSPVTLEADRVYFLVAKAKPYSIGEPIPEIVFFGAWLWPDGNGNVQDAYPDGKLWIASISSDVYTWASPDTEGDFPERHDLAFYLMLPANEMRYTASNNIPSSIETPWGPFASYVNIALPEGDGRKTVAFQLKHPSYLPLGESEILLASAVKDMTNPEVSWIIPGEHQVINGRWVIESDNLYLAVNAQD